MRHNNANNNLGRKSAHRKAMLSNMASSLIVHKRIKTTVAKAKALRTFIEPILTKSKDDTTQARRHAFSCLNDKDAVTALFREVSPKISERPGGYTRILKIGTRLGDAADMCYIELVDFNEAMLAASGAGDTKSARRSRRGGTKKKTAEAPELKPAKEGKQKQTKAAGASAQVAAKDTDEAADVDTDIKNTSSEESATSESDSKE